MTVSSATFGWDVVSSQISWDRGLGSDKRGGIKDCRTVSTVMFRLALIAERRRG